MAVNSILGMAMMAFLCPRRAYMRRYRLVMIRAKGKASDNRKWSDVVKKEELQAAETTEVPK